MRLCSVWRRWGLCRWDDSVWGLISELKPLILVVFCFFDSVFLHSSPPFVIDARCVPCCICLCVAGEAEGRKPERGVIEVLATVYVCVWVSISLFSLIATTASVSSPDPSLPLPHLSTIQAGPGWTRPPLHFPPDVLLSDCTPANPECPTCVCAPVWLLAWSVWTARRRKTRQVGGAPMAGKKRAPVVEHKLFRFSIAKRWNPDVWASFIRKKVLPSGPKPTQSVTWWRAPSPYFRTFHTMLSC